MPYCATRALCDVRYRLRECAVLLVRELPTSACPTATCPNGCSGHGACHERYVKPASCLCAQLAMSGADITCCGTVQRATATCPIPDPTA
eukprot:2239486-Rhodomonas_salina.3